VVGVFRLAPEGRLGEVMDRITRAVAGVGVGRGPSETVDVRAPFAPFRRGQGQVAEHVVERAVLEHHDHDVLDLLESRRSGIGRGGDRVRWGRRDGRGDHVDHLLPLRRQKMRHASKRLALGVFQEIAHCWSPS
jgi:hypothetical protein